MVGAPTTTSPAGFSWAWDALDLPKKATLIRVRWPFTIVCSYLLLYSQNAAISLPAVYGLVLFYLLSNFALYFADERFFDSFYFFAPLLAFDTLFLTASMAVSGTASADFYIVCFATIFLCCICRDLRGLIGVAVLSPALYGYFVMRSAEIQEPTIYLKIISPFIIALFYGYSAQVERLQSKLKKQTEMSARAARLYEDAKALAAENVSLLEQLDRAREALEKAIRVKEQFLGVMSHELRTPLNVVMGYARLLNERVLGEINAMQAEAVAKIMSRARDQLTMITDILEIAGIESGEGATGGHEVHLTALLDDLKSRYDVAEEKEVVVTWDYPADLPVVKTDAEKLKHALQNLINNALKFTHRGTVTITARTGVRDRQSAAGDHPQWLNPMTDFVEFEISDTGIGIAAEHLPYIFDRFHQIDSSDTRRYEGVGMGLHVVKKLADILGARVEVTSAPGQGSTFTLTLPFKKM
jgi:signal transduction histidine kinase